MVEQPIQRRRRHHLISEDRPPLPELLVRSQHRGRSLVALIDELEEQGRPDRQAGRHGGLPHPRRGPKTPRSPSAGGDPARTVRMVPRRGADRRQRSAARYPVTDLAQEDTTNDHSPKMEPQKGISRPKALRSPGLKALRSPGRPDSARSGCPDLRRRNDGRKNPQALQRTLGHAGRYAGRKAPGHQNAPANETPEQGPGHFLPVLRGDGIPEVMARVHKCREEFSAADRRREEMVAGERRRRWLARKRTRLYAHGPRRQRRKRRVSS